jgi:hypothetical protein
MKVQEIHELVARLTGIDTPIGGISWNPPEPDVTAARRVLTFLEDRRVLYDPAEIEHVDWSVASVLEIRSFLTQVLADQKRGEELTVNLNTMRKAARMFLTYFPPVEGGHLENLDVDDPSEYAYLDSLQTNPVLNQALGELRAVFSFHIAQIAVKFGIDLEDELAELAYTTNVAFPAFPDEED